MQQHNKEEKVCFAMAVHKRWGGDGIRGKQIAAPSTWRDKRDRRLKISRGLWGTKLTRSTTHTNAQAQ